MKVEQDSKIKVELKDNNLLIKNERKETKIDINSLTYNESYVFDEKMIIKHKVLFMHEIVDKEKNINDVIAVYSTKEGIKYVYCSRAQFYNRLVRVNNRVLKISFNKKKIQLIVLAYILNKYNLDITENSKIYINDNIYKECKLKVYNSYISVFKAIFDRNIYKYSFNMNDILNDEDSKINGQIRYTMKANGLDVDFNLRRKIKFSKNTKYYYTPIKPMYIGDYAVHLRRTFAGSLRLVKRLKEPIENDKRFKIYESKLISSIMYLVGKILTKIRIKKINIFYEKFASKAEEGVYELYKKCNQNKRTKNYFVIDEKSSDYERIKDDKNVIKKYSFKYYWIIYNCSWFIASETPSHLNILRSNNRNFRKATYDKKFLFLQHGIIYMKNLGLNSSFNVDREAGAEYMIVSSDREKEVVKKMLGYKDNQLLKTGLGMYSNIKYNHINNESENYITVMLTWKPYEEQLYEFETSSYYKNTVEIYEMLKKYIPKEEIIIISHPKAKELMQNTDFKNNIWDKPISEALEKTKLLITDYSSICYNAFYQGAGVVFYQPDLELYETENGPLIPKDNEYIGERIFNIDELENVIKNNIIDKKINLDKFRTKEFEKQYKLINEFNDGNNIERIYNELLKLKIVK